MTNNIYANVRRSARSKGNLPLWIGLAVCALLIAAFALSVGFAGRYQRNYWDYIGRLSNSTAYAYRNGTLQISVSGETRSLDKERAYQIYQLVSNAGEGRIQKALSSGEPSAILNYGKGSTLTVWEIPVSASSNEGHETDIFLLFQDEKGSYGYIAWDLSPRKFLNCFRL